MNKLSRREFLENMAVQTAAEMGLGTNHPKQMELMDISLR